MIASDGIFSPLVTHPFRPESVQVHWNPGRRQLPEGLSARIAANWQREIANRNRFLYNGVLCRLNSFEHDADTLTLSLGQTDYCELLHSNRYCQEIITEYGPEMLSAALGISAIVVTADDRLVLMHRSQVVSEYPGALDVFGGHIEMADSDPRFFPDPFVAIAQELHEELSLNPEDLQSRICLGLVRASKTWKPEMAFYTPITLTERELLMRAEQARDKMEYTDILFRNNNPRNLIESLDAGNSGQFTPSAVGCLWLYAEYASAGSKRRTYAKH